uniref:Fatty acid desaturase domain-containing protein n=1 Tax=Alexandrium monilatum TaxID=311494 RepID=A0A7S4QLQ5_9DINO
MAQVQGRSAGAAEPAESAALLVRRHCSKYGPNDLKALRTSLITFGLLYAFLALVLACPCRLAAGLLGLAIVRAFVLFHDAAHGSLTTSRAANKVVAWMVSPWIGRTSAGWSASHEQHHKILGSDPPPFNAPALAFAGLAIGDDDSRTVLFTKQEFDCWPIHQQAFARLVRDPFVFFGVLVPAQWPVRPDEYVATLLWVLHSLLVYFIGGKDSLLCLLQADWIALVIAGLLFHLQHQVNPGYWKSLAGGWNRDEACFEGSSYILVPWWLKWATLGIEYHHIHHLSARTPCYELQLCHAACDPDWLKPVVKLPMSKALRSCFHTMWNEETKRYVSFESHRKLGLQD